MFNIYNAMVVECLSYKEETCLAVVVRSFDSVSRGCPLISEFLCASKGRLDNVQILTRRGFRKAILRFVHSVLLSFAPLG